MKDAGGIGTAHNWMGLAVLVGMILAVFGFCFLAWRGVASETSRDFSVMMSGILGPLAGGLAGVAVARQAPHPSTPAPVIATEMVGRVDVKKESPAEEAGEVNG